MGTPPVIVEPSQKSGTAGAGTVRESTVSLVSGNSIVNINKSVPTTGSKDGSNTQNTLGDAADDDDLDAMISDHLEERVMEKINDLQK